MNGADVLSDLLSDPEEAMGLSFATTGITSPIGILEVAISYPGEQDVISYFLEPDGIIIPSDLNFKNTGILRSQFEDGLRTPEEFLEEVLGYMHSRPPSVCLVGNVWWLGKMKKDPANAALSPFFAAVGRRPVWPVPAYETARKASDYTLFDTQYMESMFDLIQHVERLSKQAPRDSRISSAEAVGLRELTLPPQSTKASEQANQLSELYAAMLSGTEADERMY